jgi:phosphogluconate dehydratase|tara:strand:- start:10296 stop:12107 length:1812 start_codon:yes stop_codon:yes gene_type:complete
MHAVIENVTEKLRLRSADRRGRYLDHCRQTQEQLPPKKRLSCGNIAHGYAACSDSEKSLIAGMEAANIGIINAYNDLLSAHQPLAVYPDQIKQFARELGGTAQVASGVPAMCDGVTQGQPGMEMSLFSRDVVAMATAIGLSHNMFDAGLCLGICDKIVPGMMIGALQFGHLPVAFIGSGPMSSGLPNKEKAAIRQLYAEGKASDSELLAVESASYHSAGTCTFYGTANSNQVLMEMLGVQLPGSSFLHTDDPLRPSLTRRTVESLMSCTAGSGSYRPLGQVICEESIVNALVALLASGGSTNHALHMVAIARAAGIDLQLTDFDELSQAVPLLARIYPNGSADINDFQRAGGMAYLVGELRGAGLLNESVVNILGTGLDAWCAVPESGEDGVVYWTSTVESSADTTVLAPVTAPFADEGGLRRLHGNLGECVIKVSALDEDHHSLTAPCRVFHSQEELKDAFEAGEMERDMFAVVRFQGPSANGMPELHKMTPLLGVLQDRGFKVALVTDGRMSGASGKVPAAIHLAPEAVKGGPIAMLRDGDVIELDAHRGVLNAQVPIEEWQQRTPAAAPAVQGNLGRNLFSLFRDGVGDATTGASVFEWR